MLIRIAQPLERYNRFAAFKLDVMDAAVRLHRDFEESRERVHCGYAYSLKTAGDLVSTVLKLRSCVKPRKRHLNGRYAKLRVYIYGDAAPVVFYRGGTVFQERNLDCVAKAVHGFVDCVIYYLVQTMVKSVGRS